MAVVLVVQVDGALAGRLLPLLRAGVVACHRDGVKVDSAADAFVVDVHALAGATRARRPSDDAPSTESGPARMTAPKVESVKAYAMRTGRSRQSVHRSIQRDMLRGHRDDAGHVVGVIVDEASG